MGIETATFGKRLREERKRLGLSQVVVGGAGGVSKTTQIAYESGTRTPDLKYLDLVRKLGIDAWYVLAGNRSPALTIDSQLLGVLWEAIEEFVAKHNAQILPRKRGEVLALLYSQTVKEGSVDPNFVRATLNLVS